MTVTDRPGICLAGLIPDAMAPTKETVRAALDAAASAGFDGSSVWAQLLPLVGDDGTLAGARAVLDERGLRLVMVEGAFAWATGATEEAVRAEAETLVETAETMGASLILAVCLEPTIVPRDVARARLAELARRAERAGASVCVEFLPWSGIPTLRDAWDLIGPIDDVGLILDTWHWQRQPGGPDLDALRAVPPERVGCIQVSDAPVQPSGELFEETMSGRLLPGDGDIDYAPFQRLSGHAFVAPEVFNPGLVVSRGVGPAAAAMYDATVRAMSA